MASGRKFGADFGLLFVRIALAGIFIAHGVKQLIDEQTSQIDIQGGVELFSNALANYGVPAPHSAAIATIITEIVGGIIVFLGLGWLGRVAAFALGTTMVGAIVYVHGANGFFLQLQATQPGILRHGFEYNLALLALALCIVFAGPGRIGLLTGGMGGKKKG